jgi:hypothetical protein
MLAALAGPSTLHREPTFVGRPAPPPPPHASGYANDALTRVISEAAADRQQSAYLTASGTLTQFNAIMAAIQGSVLASTGDGLLKIVVASALFLHVLAAFALCWAARPIVETPNSIRGPSLVDDHWYALDTFRNYRRGWRMTLIALSVSSVAAGLYVLLAFGISAADVTARWQ